MPTREKFINREISWLQFNDRVLQEAADENVPLVERMRFLGIFSNNRDEFFRVRVATLKRMVRLDKKGRTLATGTPREVLQEIQEVVLSQQKKFSKIYRKLLRELEAENIFLINETKLNEKQGQFVRDYFSEKVHPVVNPIMLRQVGKRPTLRDQSIYLLVKLHTPADDKKFELAMVDLPTKRVDRFLELPAEGKKKYIILLDDVIRYCLHDIFHMFGYTHAEAYTFKITRDAELDIDDDVSQSFLEKMQHSLKQRKKGDPVRFVHDKTMPPEMLQFLTKKLKLTDDSNQIAGDRYHNFKDFMGFPNVGSKNLVYRKADPVPHRSLHGQSSLLQALKNKDVVLHYPYHSFNYFIELLREAAIDPKVKFIKICIYRVASDSRVINAIINAAKNGKDVTVVVELQARFDEEANIYWSGILQEEGVRVIYGVPGLKVHSKLCLIGRKESGRMKLYANIGTGNFHEKTARIYSDVSLITADKRITNEVERVFSICENVYRPAYYYKKLLLSPMHLRNKLVRLINTEIRNAKAGKKAYMVLKMNSLVDIQLIRKLYQASQAGVKVQLIIRGICSLVPGVPGLSENIEAISILDRYLEHSRIYIFCHGGDDLCYISSADFMVRNLDHRIEVTCPILDPDCKQELIDMLNIQLADTVKARILDGSGKNMYKEGSKTGKKAVRTQFELYNYYRQLLK